MHVGEQIRAADGGAHRDAVAQPLAQDDDIGLDAIIDERKQRAGAAEVRLNLVEDEENVALAAKTFEELDVFLLRMERAAAAEVRLGDEGTDAAAVFAPEPRELGFVG